jgi:hypothetical protein
LFFFFWWEIKSIITIIIIINTYQLLHPGIRHDYIQEIFFVGASDVKFVGSDITVSDAVYKTTPGLYQLFFKNNPKNYTQKDLNTYKTILDSSNVCRLNFHISDRDQDQISTYRSIIAPLYFEQQAIYKTPKTAKKKPNPNDFVNRLRLGISCISDSRSYRSL